MVKISEMLGMVCGHNPSQFGPPFITSVHLIELEMVQSTIHTLDHVYRLPSIL